MPVGARGPWRPIMIMHRIDHRPGAIEQLNSLAIVFQLLREDHERLYSIIIRQPLCITRHNDESFASDLRSRRKLYFHTFCQAPAANIHRRIARSEEHTSEL